MTIACLHIPTAAYSLFFFCVGTVTKCLDYGKVHFVLLTQAVDLVLQGREDNLVIQDEDKEGIYVILYMGKNLGGQGDYCKRDYRALT